MRTRSRILALCAAGAAITISAASYASAGDDQTPQQAPAASPTLAEMKAQAWEGKTTAVASVPAEIAENFPIFRNEASPVPAHLVHQFASSDRFGRNAALARGIDTPNGPGWVIPGDGYVCLAVPGPAGGYGTTCALVSEALKRGLWGRHTTDREGAKAVETLILPAGINVEERTPDGTTTVKLTASADGVISELIDDADTMPVLVAAG